MLKLKGSFVALITPFKRGKVDMKALEKLIEYHIKAGTNGIVPCGTTGESPTLSHKEHRDVIARTVEVVDKRIPVIAGAGSNCTDEAVELSRYAKKVGADAVLSVVPYYNKPTQDGQYAHFAMIAKKAGIPIVLYNIPGRCGVGLTPKTVEKLSKIDLIVGIKESTGNIDIASEILSVSDITVLSGDDSLTLPLMSVGATGVISVAANIIPEDIAAMVRACAEGHTGLAKSLHLGMFKLIKTLFIETNPIPVKTAMKILKMDTGELRLPLCSMKQENFDTLKEVVLSYIKNKNSK